MCMYRQPRASLQCGTSVMTSARTSDHVTRSGLEMYYLIKTPVPVFGSALLFDLPPVSSHQDQMLRLHDISLPATIHTTCTAIQTYHISTYLDISNHIHIRHRVGRPSTLPPAPLFRANTSFHSPPRSSSNNKHRIMDLSSLYNTLSTPPDRLQQAENEMMERFKG